MNRPMQVGSGWKLAETQFLRQAKASYCLQKKITAACQWNSMDPTSSQIFLINPLCSILSSYKSNIYPANSFSRKNLNNTCNPL